MELVSGRTTIEDADAFLERVRAVGTERGAMVLPIDARYVVDREHVERAVALADRAREHSVAIADDRAMEILCFAAGTRQIEVALEMGVGTDTARVVLAIDGGDEVAAAAALEAEIETDPAVLGRYDRTIVRAFYDVGDAELSATDAGLPALVRERVALLVVER